MNIYDYVFHYNPHTELWHAIPRDVYTQYWNGREVEGVLKSKEITTLVELVNRGEEFVESLS